MYNISINQFKNFFPDAPCVSMGEDFYIMDVNLTEKNQPLGHPCRFDSFMIIYCVSGHVKINVNLEEYDLKQNMLFLNFPDNIIRVNEIFDTEEQRLHYVCVLMSREFIQGLMLDVNKIFTRKLSIIDNPSITLNEKEQQLLSDHIKLMSSLIQSEMAYKDESVRAVLASIFYMMVDVWSAKQGVNKNVQKPVSSRSRMLFEQFIQLVSEYHTQYRNVGFYSDKLCLTPKYLSRIIKEASGKSAPEWIDAYVILEAKNLLKYSRYAIKEIVFKLNFPNQSVFYKFFKARTGMTPSEYRNS